MPNSILVAGRSLVVFVAYYFLRVVFCRISCFACNWNSRAWMYSSRLPTSPRAEKKTGQGEKGFDSPCLCDDARRCDAKWLIFSVGGLRWPPLTLLLCADTSAGEEIIRTDSHEAFDECRSNSSHRTSVCNGAGTQANAQPSPGFDVRPACVHKCATTHVLMCVHKYL